MGHPSPPQPVIGLIGGIGSGKSLVAQMLAELGCAIVDADKVGHELLEKPQIVDQLTRRFGLDILDETGAVNRASLAEKAFKDAASLESLNHIIHNLLRRELERRIALLLAQGSGPVVLDAALLLETDWHELCDVLVFVESDEAQRLSRVAGQRGWSQGEWQRRENLQKPLDMKRAKSDHIVVNNSSVSHLRQQVRLLHQRLIHPAE
jgi:dephospho-CoA kinase